MSTKTTFKRVALVTVAALGFGVLTSVAPASADVVVPTAITVGTIPTSGQVGVAHSTPISIAAPYTVGGSDTFSVMVKVTSAPAGSAFQTLATNGTTGSAVTAAASFDVGAYARDGSTNNAAILTVSNPSTGILAAAQVIADKMTIGYAYTSAPRAAAGGTASLTVNVTPDKAGSYTVLVSTKNNATGAAYTGAAGEIGTSYTFTTGNAVASVSMAAVTGGTTTASDVGQLIKVTLKDSTGAAASLATGQTLNITAGGTTDQLQVVTHSAGVWTATTSNGVTDNTTLVMVGGNFFNGVGYFNYQDSTASTGNVITATGSGLLATTVSTTLTTTVKSAATGIAFAGSAITISDGTATRPGSGHTAYVSGTPGTATASTASTSHSFTVTVAALAADSFFDVKVVDTAGDITGIVGQVFNQLLTVTYDATATTQTGTLTVAAALATAGDSFTASIKDSAGWGSTAADGVTVTSADPVGTSFRPLGNSLTTGSAKTLYQTAAGSTALWATLYDQFGAVAASKAGTVSVTGRNATTTSTSFVTDASGRATFTLADAGTTATTNLQDVVTFASGSATSAVVTINYGASTASTITCLTGNEDDTATLKTYRDINAGATGTQAGAASLCTVTVKDANGGVLVGFPVTVTTASEGAAVVSTSATLYTGAAGTVAPSVYGWTTGTKTFTITAGTATKAVTVNYAQLTAADVRTISAVASGSSITVTAKDRFGNLVPGVNIYATRTGNGLFGGGSNTANAITDGYNSGTNPTPASNGTAEFIFNAGTADSVVTFKVASAANTPVAGFGQTSSTVGKVCAGAECTDTAVTAATVGTIYTAETGIGSSLAPAGINSVTVAVAAGTDAAADNAQAATDAAAEATDAANAATDAANAAAEAADAATAAAQDAADAVAALSAQVASLISGLKSQLTALTNLVIKIQKKVKA